MVASHWVLGTRWMVMHMLEMDLLDNLDCV
jgi:hypothetical protein